ncbi:helix-turn-helix domain-containing protein [Streptomyces sp. NPDC056987]|uniref:helix-turn-helix domain-containing protein n=1 Tax=Streptomyces sp. NPDC056987 TaxID=3345988 RepID=UPI0036398877
MSTPEPVRPTVGRRQLGAELNRLRTAKGIKLKDVAEYLGTSPTRAGRLESGRGRVMPKAEEIRKLCALYDVTDERQIQRLIEMLPAPKQPGWWDPYRELLPSGLEVFLELETNALDERAWEPVLVHGLLQTPEYARAVIETGPTNRQTDVEDLVEARTKRRELLTSARVGRDPLALWVILDEAVIRRPIGGPTVMRGQLEHLIVMAALPSVTLQIVPQAKGAHPGLGGAFSLLEFEDEPPIAYVDCPAGNLYLEKKTEVRRFTTTFDLLRAVAHDPLESAAILHSAAKEMK